MVKEELKDLAAERAILAGICQYGLDAYVDASGIININHFNDIDNQKIYNCLQYILDNGSKVDIPSILSASNTLKLNLDLQDKGYAEFIKSLFSVKVNLENVAKHAIKLRKIDLIKEIQNSGYGIYKACQNLNGNESIDEILSTGEKPIFDIGLSLNLGKGNVGPDKLSDDIDEFIQEKIDNTIDNIGIPTPFPIYNECIGTGIRTGVALIASRPKCQPLTAKILTPDGWITYKDVKAGDIICHPDGGTTKVLKLFATGVKSVYEFEFSDGSKTQACKEHRWKAKRKKDKDYIDVSLEEINMFPDKWYFTRSKPIEFVEKKHDIHPFVFGFMISKCKISGKKLIIKTKSIKKLNSLLSKDNQFKETSKKDYYFVINNDSFKEIFEVLSDKSQAYIPKEYMFDSIKNRESLLEGLSFEKGKVIKDVLYKYITYSKKLSEDISQLIRSIGNFATAITIKFYKSEKNHDKYLVSGSIKNDNKQVISRTLKKVSFVNHLETKCIKVDAPDEMYITDDFIPTKNTGKTTFAKEVALHVAGKLKFPVLFLDSEMNKNQQLERSLASIADINIRRVELGHFKYDVDEMQRIKNAVEYIKTLPIYHQRIAGKQFAEVISLIRRWIHKQVGFNENGKANPHLIIYDYFKLMSASHMGDLSEHQALGFQISELSDFCQEFETPVLAFVQVNRDGVNKDTAEVISQSDRLLWLATSVTIFKRKSEEEIGQDGKQNGNMKAIPVEARFGKPLSDGDYINMSMDHDKSKIKELSTNHKGGEGFEEESGKDKDEYSF